MTNPVLGERSRTRAVTAVYVGSGKRLLADEFSALIEEVVVDTHLHLPDMFEIAFRDPDATVLGRAGMTIGTAVAVAGAAPAKPDRPYTLVSGEITAIEGIFDTRGRTVIRGYSQDHRLQRAARTRTFLNMTDSDIARKIATDAGLTIGTVEPTRTTHQHVGQVNQTDWEFLAARAALIGYEVGVTAGEFHFRRASGTKSAGAPRELTLGKDLRSFNPRITAGNLASETEVRVWDPLETKVTSAKAATASTSVALDSADPARCAAVFDGTQVPTPVAAANPALGDLGPPPSDHGHVRSTLTLATGAATGPATDEAGAGAIEHAGSTFAEATGRCIGDPLLFAGTAVRVTGVAPVFCGTWVLTRCRHVFDLDGYHTDFEVSGRHERSLLGLATGGQAHGAPARMPGLVCAIVSNIDDPEQKGRVKLTLPWLSPQYETDWSPVIQPGGGKRSGALLVPEVGDEVLAGFEFGDPQRPYVLGGVLNRHSTYQLGGPPVKAGASPSVVWRGFVSSSGNRLAFHDELPPGAAGAPPTASEIVLGTKDAALALAVDQVAGTVALTCKPAPPASKSSAGHLTIECGNAGVIDIKTGPGGTVNVDGGAQLNLKAQAAVKIESGGVVEIKGNPIKLN